MDDPVKEIEGVVRLLTQGSPKEQAAAVNRYFAPNAEFLHPFCRVPPFQNFSVPLLGQINSRQLVLAVLRWYRIISPRIDLKLNSVHFDPAADRLYLDISQRFALWFVPFMVANVNLVTRLSLVKTGGRQSQVADSLHPRLTNGDKPGHGHSLAKEIQEGESPSFAEVASSGRPLLSGESKGDGHYLIAKQEDLYQVNEFVKFVLPFGIGDALVSLWQLFATTMCLAGTLALFPLVWILTHGGEGGNVMPPAKRAEDDGDGRVAWDGVGADWARRTFSPLNGVGTGAVRDVVVNVQENASALVEKGETAASEVQQRARRAVHDVRTREEALVKTAQQKAKGLADEVQQRADSLVDNAQQKGKRLLQAAQQKEREFARNARAKEEESVRNLRAGEEQAAENTRQWWAANKKG